MAFQIIQFHIVNPSTAANLLYAMLIILMYMIVNVYMESVFYSLLLVLLFPFGVVLSLYHVSLYILWNSELLIFPCITITKTHSCTLIVFGE